MAEFRKREDITQEIDLLQQWSDMGAPRMGELAPTLRSLVKSFDPSLVKQVDIRTSTAPPPPPGRSAMPAPSSPRLRDAATRPVAASGEDGDRGWPPEGPPPPEFANLPPGDEEAQPSRTAFMPLLLGALVLGAAIAFVWAKDAGGLFGPTGEPLAGASPGPSPHRSMPPPPGASAQALPIAVASPSTLMAAVPSTVATTPAHAASPVWPASATPPRAQRPKPQLPGLRPPRPIVRAATPAAIYMVRRGDSLSAIAKRELGDMHRWPELRAANAADISDPDLIHPGLKLRIPRAASIEVPQRVHVVRPGESLKTIAKAKLGGAERWRELWDLNRDRLTAQTLLPPGTKLRLPLDASSVPPSQSAKQVASGRTKRHVVQPGESLSLLAQRYLGSATRWPELYYLNQAKIANPAWLYPGQIIAIPVSGARPFRYIVRTGDTLWGISARHMGTPYRWPRLYGANRDRIANPHWIYPGQTFRLPR